MPAAGHGIVEFERVVGRTALVRSLASSPLRLLAPRRPGNCAWLTSATLGGGLLAGDSIHLDINAGADCSAVIGTQASTKIYCSPAKLASRQQLHARVGDASLLVLAPDPVTCFADSIYEQRQRFDLMPSSSLVVVDWITSGRWARGERWAMTRCWLRTDIFVAGRQILRDAIRLDGSHAARMGRFNCWASVIVWGDRLSGAIDQTLQAVAAQEVPARADLIFSAGPIPGGMLLRIAGRSTEQVLRFFRRRLNFVADLAGDDPWDRKG